MRHAMRAKQSTPVVRARGSGGDVKQRRWIAGTDRTIVINAVYTQKCIETIGCHCSLVSK
jgi:hypothetical protein